VLRYVTLCVSVAVRVLVGWQEVLRKGGVGDGNVEILGDEQSTIGAVLAKLPTYRYACKAIFRAFFGRLWHLLFSAALWSPHGG